MTKAKIKPWYKSKTILWAIFSGFISIFGIVFLIYSQFNHTTEVSSMLLLNLLSSLQTIHGRFKAEHKVYFTKKQAKQLQQTDNSSLLELLVILINLIERFLTSKRGITK